MKKIWAVRKDSEAVSPVIATILMVAITVVLAAVLYVMVLGFGTGGSNTPQTSLSATSVTNGKRLELAAITQQVQWGDVRLVIEDGTNTATVSPVTTDLDGGTTVRAYYNTTLGSAMTFYIVDLLGDGFLSQGDYAVMTFASGLTSGTTYTVTLVYEPTGGQMARTTFVG